MHSASSKNFEEMRMEGMSLAMELIQKLEENTPFTIEDEIRFFGKSPSFNLPTMIYIQLGYMRGEGTLLKKLPKYSFYGELLRLNRKLILPASSGDVKELFASNSYSWLVDGKLIPRTGHYIHIFIYSYNIDNNFAYSDEHLICIPYNAIGKCLFEPITINGKSIMRELGFSHDRTKNERGLNQEVLKKLEEHIGKLKDDK